MEITHKCEKYVLICLQRIQMGIWSNEHQKYLPFIPGFLAQDKKSSHIVILMVYLLSNADILGKWIYLQNA